MYNHYRHNHLNDKVKGILRNESKDRDEVMKKEEVHSGMRQSCI